MLTGEIAKAQIQDRVRAAQMDRMARESLNREEPRRVVRKVGSGILAAVMSVVRPHPAPVTPLTRITSRC